MEINRNQYFMMGLILLALGVQLRMVESFVLTPETTQVLARTANGDQSGNPLALIASSTAAKKVLRHPDWAGWALVSIGAVLVLHSLAMPKPG